MLTEKEGEESQVVTLVTDLYENLNEGPSIIAKAKKIRILDIHGPDKNTGREFIPPFPLHYIRRKSLSLPPLKARFLRI